MENEVFLNMFRVELLGEVVTGLALFWLAAFSFVCKITFVKFFYFCRFVLS